MKVVSSAWINTDYNDLKRDHCIETHLISNKATAKNPHSIFILDGFEKIDNRFKDILKEKFIYLIDASKLTEECEKIYKEKIYNNVLCSVNKYELYCFLRWIIINNLLGGERFLHIDLDLFFQENYDVISVLFNEETGTYGSPCLTSVGNKVWIETYQNALNTICENRDSFEADIKYQGSGFRKNIGSDQDLVQALENYGLLNMLDPKKKKFESYSIFANPVYPYIWKPEKPISFSFENGCDYFDKKKVLFWHFQNNASDYFSRFALYYHFAPQWIRDLGEIKFCVPFGHIENNGENFAFEILKNIAKNWYNGSEKQMNDIQSVFQRSWITNEFINKKQFRNAFSGKLWWEEGIFV